MYRLEGCICDHCGTRLFPPRDVCPECSKPASTPYTFGGKGEVYSYSTIYQPPTGFEEFVPYTVALVKLEEGPMITAQLTDVEADDLAIGRPVEMVTRRTQEDDEDGLVVYGYKFRSLPLENKRELEQEWKVDWNTIERRSRQLNQDLPMVAAAALLEGCGADSSVVVDSAYRLFVKISHAASGEPSDPSNCLPDIEAPEIMVVVRGVDMEIFPHPAQKLEFIEGKDSNPLEFILIPREVGHKHVQIEFYYQNHWLTQLKFEGIMVVAATTGLYHYSVESGTRVSKEGLSRPNQQKLPGDVA